MNAAATALFVLLTSDEIDLHSAASMTGDVGDIASELLSLKDAADESGWVAVAAHASGPVSRAPTRRGAAARAVRRARYQGARGCGEAMSAHGDLRNYRLETTSMGALVWHLEHDECEP
jgi:hypothetical protein